MNWKQTMGLRAFGLLKIPLIFFVSPSVVKLTSRECEIRIPLNRLTRNHLGSMYFGTLAIGADCAGGLLAMEAIRRSKQKVSLVFKDFKANFLRRPLADVHFICREGQQIEKLVRKAIREKKRVDRTLLITAITPKLSGKEAVAKFELTLSLKAQA
jgi:uncharacterized protein DUF4442